MQEITNSYGIQHPSRSSWADIPYQKTREESLTNGQTLPSAQLDRMYIFKSYKI